jgi:hypothetical protein
VWEISEDDIRFLCAMNQCHQKILGLRVGNIVHLGIWHFSLEVPALGMKIFALGMKVSALGMKVLAFGMKVLAFGIIH